VNSRVVISEREYTVFVCRLVIIVNSRVVISERVYCVCI